MTSNNNGKAARTYMTDLRRVSIIREAILNRDFPGSEYDALLSKSCEMLRKKAIGVCDTQPRRMLYYSDPEGSAFIVVLLDGITARKYWAVWELTTDTNKCIEVPKWRGFIHDISFLWM